MTSQQHQSCNVELSAQQQERAEAQLVVLALLKQAAQHAGHSYTLSHNAPLNSQYFLLLFRLLCHLEGSTSMQDVSLRQVFKMWHALCRWRGCSASLPQSTPPWHSSRTTSPVLTPPACLPWPTCMQRMSARYATCAEDIVAPAKKASRLQHGLLSLLCTPPPPMPLPSTAFFALQNQHCIAANLSGCSAVMQTCALHVCWQNMHSHIVQNMIDGSLHCIDAGQPSS